ncbi:ATP-binding protein [Breznakiella homolactica]|uniref:ATP-binding protein n=1 Tax=Breznakiella homolactica TaxID=2798577 RepID=A0A7T7XK58_9SPIR|nr:ATP-binding protein [Breznakiella homolactica]QQO07678.1 ATP-binding protein [Breznakiella homolactica]
MKGLIVRKLIVDEHNELFDAQGMKYREFPSNFSRIRDYSESILTHCPREFLEGGLLDQQLSEIIKNGIKHGNKCDPSKKIRIWYDLRKRVRLIVEDEGPGFVELEEWNRFYSRRQEALAAGDFEGFLELAKYRGAHSDEHDGGNSLIAALEYWNGGMVFNGKKNKIGVVRWFTNGSQ